MQTFDIALRFVEIAHTSNYFTFNVNVVSLSSPSVEKFLLPFDTWQFSHVPKCVGTFSIRTWKEGCLGGLKRGKGPSFSKRSAGTR